MSFSDPQVVIDQCALGESTVVADLGAGSGAYTFAAAKAVGPDGKVFAVEVQKELLSRIKNAAVTLGLLNVDVIWGDIEKPGGSKLRDQSIDTVFLGNVLFQAENRETLIIEAVRIIKSKGKLILIDWTDSFGNLGPTPQMVVKEQDAKALLEAQGLTFERNIDAGDHHYGLIYRKQ